jgi:hypothetical protein
MPILLIRDMTETLCPVWPMAMHKGKLTARRLVITFVIAFADSFPVRAQFIRFPARRGPISIFILRIGTQRNS